MFLASFSFSPPILLRSTRESLPSPPLQSRACDVNRTRLLSQRAIVIGTSFLAWSVCVGCPSDTLSGHGTTCCMRTPALPENKNSFPTAFSDLSNLLTPLLLFENAHVSVSGATPSIGFLGNPPSHAMRLTPSQLPEKAWLVPTFLSFVWRRLRLVLYTGFLGSEPWSLWYMPSPYPSPIWSSQYST